MKSKDNNVQALYDAENNELPVGEQFSDLPDVQAFADFVTGSMFWRNCIAEGAKLPISFVLRDNGDRKESEASDPNIIWLANKHRHTQAVLHEIAHSFSHGHGPKFVRSYLNLIAHFMGLEYRVLYGRIFSRDGIKF